MTVIAVSGGIAREKLARAVDGREDSPAPGPRGRNGLPGTARLHVNRDDLRDRLAAALADPRTVAARLGLDRGARHQHGRGLTVHCVWHDERTPSLSMHVGPSGRLGVRCWGCGASGDVFSLLAQVFGCSLPRDFGEVLQHAAALAGEHLPEFPQRPATPPPERQPPPIEEVRRVLSEGLAPTDGPAAAWLRSRALDPQASAKFCRVLRSAWPAWARTSRGPWVGTSYRLLLPVYDARGALRSVRARSIRPEGAPKEVPPFGCRAAGFVFASPTAVGMLRGGPAGAQARVLVAEGTPDYLTWASRLHGSSWAVLGLPGSGAWSRELADRIPSGSEVVIRTDPDDAGDRYAMIAAQHLAERCRVLVTGAEERAARRVACERSQAAGGTPSSGARGRDDNDLLIAGELPRDPRVGAT